MRAHTRLIVALAMVAMLTGLLLYTALAGGAVSRPVIDTAVLDEQRELVSSETVELVGVAAGPITDTADGISFFMTGTKGENRTEVAYPGSVPDVFRAGRSVVVRGMLDGDIFRAEPNSLSTKCPSRFDAAGDNPPA